MQSEIAAFLCSEFYPISIREIIESIDRVETPPDLPGGEEGVLVTPNSYTCAS